MDMQVKVYLNESDDHFFGYDPDTAQLRMAVEFSAGITDVDGALNEIWEQLNIGGDPDMGVPAAEYTVRYRAARNRSLSVGDVVVVGELAFAVASSGFDRVTLDHSHIIG